MQEKTIKHFSVRTYVVFFFSGLGNTDQIQKQDAKARRRNLVFFIFKFLKQIPDAYFVLKMEIDMAMHIDRMYLQGAEKIKIGMWRSIKS